MKLNYEKSFFKSAKAVYEITNGLYNLSFPLDIFEIISKDKRIKLVTFSEFSQNTGTLYFKIPSIFGSEEAFHIRKGDKAIIVYNDLLPMNRLRFTLAHEYGHFIMGHTGVNLNKTFTYKDYYRGIAEEYEANSFASCLLFPLHIRYKYINNFNIEQISYKYQMSFQAIHIAVKVIRRHIHNGLNDYMSNNENYHAENYLSFLEEKMESKSDFINEFKYAYDLTI
ncbi:TPA: ImmA/IrrE family metallo-endopeptidase [Staphylococcus aureus]|nr:ImmA/IrrE family metallo-endopeptidase [Staphylococcus aureus]HDF1259475.1 ImmA/IrrE family metallo-endopeptidase [Staphylococcus aureus]